MAAMLVSAGAGSLRGRRRRRFAYHESWYDEAQAWLIARDCNLFTMLSQFRYEGHPPLWYLILKVAMWCGLPYEAFGLLSGAIATGGVGLFLLKSPFPKPLTALLPFTFFFAFQYAVIAALLRARSVAAVRCCHPCPTPMGPANSLGRCGDAVGGRVLHTFLMAGGIMFVHLLELAFRRRRLDGKAWKGQIAAISLCAFGALLLVLILWPPGDNSEATALNGMFTYAKLRLDTTAAVDSALFGCPLLTVGLLALSCYWFWRTGVFGLFLAVWLPVLGIFLTIRAAEQHHGILFFAWLFVLWCSGDALAAMRRRQAVDKPLTWTWRAMLCLTVGLIVRQGIWTGCSVASEMEHPYCGAPALAKYIKAHDLTKYRVAGVRDWVAAVLPYFPKNFIVNYPNRDGKSFIDYHRSQHPTDTAFSDSGCLTTPCDVIIWPNVVSVSKEADEPDVYFAPTIPPNWQFIGNFPGRIIFKDQFIYKHGYALFTTKRVADQLGLSAVECERADAEQQTAEVSSRAEGKPGDRELASVTVTMAFGNLLRQIEPESARWAYETAIRTLRYGATHKSVSGEDFEKREKLECAAHSNLGALLANSQPKVRAETLAGGVAVGTQQSERVRQYWCDSGPGRTIPESGDRISASPEHRPPE